MHRYLDRLETTLMFGVGAAYDFHTGRIKDAPQWVKSIGMQWLHRLLQDPRRLWKRYLRSNTAFLWHIGLQIAGFRLPAEPIAVQQIIREAGDAETNVRLISAGAQSREV